MKRTHFENLVLVLVGALALLTGFVRTPESSAQISKLFSQDLTIHETTTGTGMGMGGGKESKSTNYFSGNAMKHSSPDADFIMRYDQGKIIMIDHKKKTYSDFTFEQLQQMLDKTAAEMSKDKEAMEAMRRMMGQTMGQISVSKQGPGETIVGYSTEKYLVKGPMEMEIWAAPDLKIPPAYYDALKLRAPANPMFDMRKIYDEFKKIQGMTMKSVTTMKMMNMTMTTTTVVSSVEKGPIPASTFEVPAGYKAAPPKL